jgi:hypothetical protein
MLTVATGACLGVAQPVFPAWVKIALQLVIGTFSGCRLDQDAVNRIRAMSRLVAFTTVWTIGSTLVIGFVLARLTGMRLATALLGTNPGGVAEMSAMAMTVDASVAMVATLQLFRLILTLGLVPIFAKRLVTPGPSERAARVTLVKPNHGMDLVPLVAEDLKRPPHSAGGNPKAWIVALVLGTLGGLAFGGLGVPAGAVVGSMAFVAFARGSGWNVKPPPVFLRTVAQIGMGVLIGTTFNGETLAQLQGTLLAVVGATAATIASGLGLARIVRDQLGTDTQTAVLACAPAGVIQMAIVADEVGADILTVTLFQLTRLICAVSVLPIVFRLFI